jgi:hypothetical protein
VPHIVRLLSSPDEGLQARRGAGLEDTRAVLHGSQTAYRTAMHLRRTFSSEHELVAPSATPFLWLVDAADTANGVGRVRPTFGAPRQMHKQEPGLARTLNNSRKSFQHTRTRTRTRAHAHASPFSVLPTQPPTHAPTKPPTQPPTQPLTHPATHPPTHLSVTLSVSLPLLNRSTPRHVPPSWPRASRARLHLALRGRKPRSCRRVGVRQGTPNPLSTRSLPLPTPIDRSQYREGRSSLVQARATSIKGRANTAPPPLCERR